MKPGKSFVSIGREILFLTDADAIKLHQMNPDSLLVVPKSFKQYDELMELWATQQTDGRFNGRKMLTEFQKRQNVLHGTKSLDFGK